MFVTTHCAKCNAEIKEAAPPLAYLCAEMTCDACYEAQERDFSQKLPVKVCVVWEVG